MSFNWLTRFFSDKLKSKYVLDIEEVFFELENLGFKKKYNNYGNEQNLSYSIPNIQILFSWVTNDNNPSVTLIVNNTNYDLSNIRNVILNKHSFDSTNILKQNYFIFTTVTRKEYLRAYFEEIIKHVQFTAKHSE